VWLIFNLIRVGQLRPDVDQGQCTPCRVGTEKAVKLMQRPVWDAALLDELSQAMADASICGLGQAAPNPLKMVLKHFPEDLTRSRHG
jgi:formate dehydrogenase